ncbi:hypothetical protein Z947_3049 [Sulfitobacter geojensis]|nr:hypothetical protein Z947_3049 [Sulfitobacter geojensis]
MLDAGALAVTGSVLTTPAGATAGAVFSDEVVRASALVVAALAGAAAVEPAPVAP